MFFVLYISVMLNYITITNNYVLKRTRHEHDDHVILPGVCNNSFHYTTRRLIFGIQENLNNTIDYNPKLKALNVHQYDKKLTNEMLSIKQYVKDREFHISTTLKSHDDKLDMFSLPAAIDKDLQSVDNFDFRHLFPEEKYIEHSSNDSPFENTVIGQYKQSEDKIVDLRSLTEHEFSDEGDDEKFKSINICTCNQSLINTRALAYDGFTNPKIPTGAHRCQGCTRTSMSYTLLPYYLPYQPYYYQSNMIASVSRRPQNEDYENIEHSHTDFNSDEGDEEYDRDLIKKHKRKKHKHRKKDKLTTINEDYESKSTEVDINDLLVKGDHNKLAKDFFDDLSMIYPDNVMKKCYCSSSTTYSCVLLLFVGLLLFTLSDAIVKKLLQE